MDAAQAAVAWRAERAGYFTKEDARLVFGLTVYAEPDAGSLKPILRLPNLYLRFADVAWDR